jgi:hypothetical protein
VCEPDGAQISMSRRQSTGKRAFVLEVGGRAVLAFPAGNARQATYFCAQDWFTAELRAYRSGGQPIWDGTRELTIRCADASEAAKLDIALETELVRGEYDGFVFAFLVAVDAAPQ